MRKWKVQINLICQTGDVATNDQVKEVFRNTVSRLRGVLEITSMFVEEIKSERKLSIPKERKEVI